MAKFCHVRKSGVLTHGKNSHEGGRIETSLCPLVRPAGVEPLEVRFAHPVRLSPDTHSQGHGRPCLQRLHTPPGFFATCSFSVIRFGVISWFLLTPIGVFPWNEFTLVVHFLDPFSVVHFVPRKRFRQYQVCLWMRFVPRKRFNLHRMCSFAPIYICSLKQQYREICVKMQQYLCELHLCMDGWEGGECGLVIMKRIAS